MEANRKRTQVHILPTEDASHIFMLDNALRYSKIKTKVEKPNSNQCYNLYFTTDEEIKEGDWMMNLNGDKIYQHFGIGVGVDFEQWNKIIASTDPEPNLHQFVLELPQPSQAFIKGYCEQGGFDEVDVEYVEMITCKLCNKSEEECSDNFTCEGNMIGEDILKVDPIHNTITTHRIVEKMYSIDDIEAYCDKYPNDTELGREIRKLRYKQ